jgi:hypothetical protein
MSGYQTILRIRRIEETVAKLGFMLSNSRYGWDNSNPDMVALKPRDEDAVPIYARDTEVFRGTLEELEVWLRGVEWARDYDRMLRISDDKKRAQGEDRERLRIAEMRKREEQKMILDVLKSSDRENTKAKK